MSHRFSRLLVLFLVLFFLLCSLYHNGLVSGCLFCRLGISLHSDGIPQGDFEIIAQKEVVLLGFIEMVAVAPAIGLTDLPSRAPPA